MTRLKFDGSCKALQQVAKVIQLDKTHPLHAGVLTGRVRVFASTHTCSSVFNTFTCEKSQEIPLYLALFKCLGCDVVKEEETIKYIPPLLGIWLNLLLTGSFHFIFSPKNLHYGHFSIEELLVQSKNYKVKTTLLCSSCCCCFLACILVEHPQYDVDNRRIFENIFKQVNTGHPKV